MTLSPLEILAENDPRDCFAAVFDADERLASFVAALDGAGSHDAKRELWLQAIDDSQLENDLRTLFGVPVPNTLSVSDLGSVHPKRET